MAIMTKEQFTETIDALREIYDYKTKISELTHVAGRNLKDDIVLNFPALEGQLIRSLEIMFDDQEENSYYGSNITWFCYETNFGRCDPDGYTIIYDEPTEPINSAVILYDFLIKNMDDKQTQN